MGASSTCSALGCRANVLARARAHPVRGKGIAPPRLVEAVNVRFSHLLPEFKRTPGRDNGVAVDDGLCQELRLHTVKHYRQEAKELLRAVRQGDPPAWARAREALGDRAAQRFLLADALHVIALEHGFRSWPDVKRAEAQQQHHHRGAEPVIHSVTQAAGWLAAAASGEARPGRDAGIRRHDAARDHESITQPEATAPVPVRRGTQSSDPRVDETSPAASQGGPMDRARSMQLDGGRSQRSGPVIRPGCAHCSTGIPSWCTRIRA
jgi:hypothetical protein